MKLTRALIGTTVAATALAGCFGSDTGGLEVGDCVEFDSIDFTFGGDISTTSCANLQIVNDVYRVTATGSESEIDRVCRFPNLSIVDGDDAACLSK